VPRSVYSLLQSRLARLGDPARRVLDAAVAAGRTFPFEVVYRAAGLSETAGLDALDELNAAHIIHPAVPPDSAPGSPALTYYAFDHSLTMEVAYREAGEPRHRRMHRRVAEALEQIYGRQHTESVAGVLAFHLFEGNEPERAAPYAALAGQQALRLAAWAEAIDFFEQALHAAAEPAQRLALAQQLGEAHFAAGHIDSAAEAQSLAHRLALDLEDDARVEATALALARTQLSQARYGEVRRLAGQVLASDPPPLIAAQAEFAIATAYSLEGADLVQASAHLLATQRHLETAAEQGQVDEARRAQVKFELGSIAAQRGDLEAAVALYREAIAIADQANVPEAQPHRILARNNLAYHLHLLSPGSAEAQSVAEVGLNLAQAAGFLALLPYLYSTLGEIALGRGDLDAAEQSFSRGLALAEQQPLPERVAGLTANLGLVAQARGEHSLALHRLSAAMAHADALGTHHLAAQIRLWLAALLPPAEARARLAEARAFAQSGGRTRLLAEAEALEQRLA
jgi:tetratricopeptide (TPR) repeat protein